MITRRNLLMTAAMPLVLAACGGINVPDLKTAAKEVAHDAITGAAQDIATIGEAFAKKLLPTLAQQAGPAAADVVRGLLAEIGNDALEMAKTKATSVATSLMDRASKAIGDVVHLAQSKVSGVNAHDVIQAAVALLPVAKSALGMLVPPMAGAMPPDQARAVLRRAAA